MKKELILILVLIALALASCTQRKVYKAVSIENNTAMQINSYDKVNYKVGDTVWVDDSQIITAVDSNTMKCVITETNGSTIEIGKL